MVNESPSLGEKGKKFHSLRVQMGKKKGTEIQRKREWGGFVGKGSSCPLGKGFLMFDS